MRLTSSADLLEVRVLLLMRVMARESTADTSHATVMTSTICATVWETEIRPDRSSACVTCKFKKCIYMHSLLFWGKRIKWLILPLHESETDRHLIGLSG